MEKDALTAGVEPAGGLFSTVEIKILICYILSSIDDPIPASMLSNQLHYEGIANAFEVSDAITSLYKNGMISLADENLDAYTITSTGRDIAKTLETSLSLTVRDRAYKAAIKMMTRFKNAKNSEIKIFNENGKTYIQCSALDGNCPFVGVKLLVSDESQAHYIKERFLNHSSEIYSGIIELLTKYEDF